jgi:hypothetical protein
MDGAELIERLTGIVRQQASIIQQLYNSVAQLNAVTALEQKIEAAQAELHDLSPYLPDNNAK